MTFPATPLDVAVELYYSSTWNDITSYVRVADGIVMQFGRGDVGQKITPSVCRMVLDNRDGRFSLRNPESPLYGLIGRNTPLRVKVTYGATTYTRFYGEVPAWPVSWEPSGVDVVAPIEANGVTRRLTQGATPQKSPLRRQLDGLSTALAYWPCEDAAGAASVASAVPGVDPMRIVGTPEIAAYSALSSSLPIPTMGTAMFSGKIPDYTVPTNGPQIRFAMSVPDAGDSGTIMSLEMSGPDIRRVELVLNGSGNIAVISYDKSDAVIIDSGYLVTDVNGKDCMVSFSIEDDAGTAYYTLQVVRQHDPSFVFMDGYVAGYLGKYTRLTFAPNVNIPTVAIGHILVDNQRVDGLGIADAFNSWRGETSTARFSRLISETDGISGVATGDNPVALGDQLPAALLDLIDEIEASDGIVREARSFAGYYLDTTTEMASQDPALTLSFATPGVESATPVDDDEQVRNDVTVTRIGGSSARATLDSGPLSTQEPPNGIGRYDEQVDLSLYSDDQVADHATWRLHIGTLDAPRWTGVTVLLAVLTSGIPDATSVDVGSVIELTNLPDFMPSGPARGLVIGYEERIAPYAWTLTFVTVPADPYDVVTLDDSDFDRLDADGCVLGSNITSSGTSISMVSSTTPLVDSTGYPAEFPLDIMIGGEVMTLTAVSGTGLTQTGTVTRSVNGVTKSHSAGASIALARPMYLGL